MEIICIFKDALIRQAEESVRIQARKPSELMNSKSQVNHPPIARIFVDKNHKHFNDGYRAKLGSGL